LVLAVAQLLVDEEATVTHHLLQASRPPVVAVEDLARQVCKLSSRRLGATVHPVAARITATLPVAAKASAVWGMMAAGLQLTSPAVPVAVENLRLE
jgi:hypothetical protein